MGKLEITSSVLIFLAGYILNMFYITVLYHRALAHNALEISPKIKIMICLSGIWITGIDPKTWICMHRLHHEHSDTELDPHTPVKCKNMFQMFLLQYKSYNKTMTYLIKGKLKQNNLVQDLGFDVHWICKNKLWYVPYIVQFVIAVIMAFYFNYLIAIFYFLGIVSHPIQGCLVNYFGHHKGYKNFKLQDDSVNNYVVALLTMGEGFQNNHHYNPQSAKFSAKWWEIDLGYYMCLVAKRVRIVNKVHKY